MSKIKLGIIGYGNMGSGHVKNILKGKCPEVELAAVADIDPARLEACKQAIADFNAEHPDAKVGEPLLFESAEKMMDAKVVDAVLVAVPHYDHPSLVIAALERGIHALSEKPAGVYTLQVREMMACADRHPDLVFGMMFNQRTNPVFRKMREIIQSGELGQIKRTSWIITNWYRPQFYYDSGAWRATWSGEGGGVLLNQCPHNLDLWQWICGMPKRIQAHLHYGKWHDIEVEDDVTAYAEYENGATGTFITTTGDAPGTNRFEVVCDGGTLLCEDGKKLTLKKLSVPESEFSKTTTKAFSAPSVEVITPELEGENSQHVGVLNAFAAAILRGEPLIADGREGINGLMISNAMHLSSFENRMVELPFDEQRYYELLMERVKTSRRKVNVSSVVSDTEGSYNS
ncbi:MAG: Gfo/Idh/MocA family oxidoreductase [Clostridia bacterium]|nr:Gfo/Idh/MocA family oxidoreductase [Clostridia bacterium]